MTDAADSPYIQLDQALKLRGDVATGGQAKALIQGGEIRVNGEVETRRGRKLRLGDTVEFKGATFAIDESLLTRSSDTD